MKSFLPLLFCVVFVMQLNAQNLVPNGSFEELIGCPQGIGELDSCVGWFTEANSPDCLGSCSPYPVSVPSNLFGSQFPFEGNNYVGIIPFVSYGGNYREIIGAKLIDSMTTGNNYHFSMRACRGFNENEYVVVACNHLGAKFSKVKHVTDYSFSYDNLQQLYEDSIVTDSVNWLLLQWDYTADSNYEYIYVGNFFDNAHTDTLNASQAGTYAYYYVDSINLYCVSENCTAEVLNVENSNSWIHYEQGSCNLSFHMNGTGTAEFFLINIIGEELLKATVSDNIEIGLSSMPNGIYVGLLKTRNGSLVKKILVN